MEHRSLIKAVKTLWYCFVTKSWATLCDHLDSVRGILQARIVERVAISLCRGSSWPRDWTRVSSIGRRILYHWATWEALWYLDGVYICPNSLKVQCWVNCSIIHGLGWLWHVIASSPVLTNDRQGNIWEASVPSAQFCCEPKAALKNKVYWKQNKDKTICHNHQGIKLRR